MTAVVGDFCFISSILHVLISCVVMERVFLLVVVTTLLGNAFEGQVDGASTTLKSGFGVNFKRVGSIQPSLNKRYITLAFELPQYEPDVYDDLVVECPFEDKHYSEYIMYSVNYICQVFNTTMAAHIKERQVNDVIILDEILHIRSVLPYPPGGGRGKRGLALVFGISAGILNIVNTVDMRRRIAALRYSHHKVVQAHATNTKMIMDNQNDILQIAEIIAQGFQNVRSDLNKTVVLVKNVSHTLHNEIQYLAERFQGNIDTLIISSRMIATVSTKLSVALHDASVSYSNMRWYLHDYAEGIVDIMQGKLPSSLIPPHQLQTVLDDAIHNLQGNFPNYELVFKSVSHYYRKTDVTYAVEDNILYVLVPIMIKKANQDSLDLYRIETCHVPFDVSKPATHNPSTHTRVSITTDYIAVSGNNFAELTQSQLDSCDHYNGLFLCDNFILQVHSSAYTCQSALFYDASPAIINEFCHFQYFQAIKPSPCILESESHVLLANLGNRWSFRCRDENVPRRANGSDYAVLAKSSLCNCALVGDTFFVAQQIGNCTPHFHDNKLFYPMNAAVATVFYSYLSNSGYMANMSQLYTAPPDLHVPPLKVTHSDDGSDVLFVDDLTTSVSLKKLRDTIARRKEVYLSTAQKENAEIANLESWFRNKRNWAIGLTFILSIIGTIAAGIAIYTCVKSHRLMSIFGLMLSRPDAAAAMQDLSDVDSESLFLNRLYDKLFQVIFLMIIFLIYKLAKALYVKWSVIRIALPNAVASSGNVMSHLHLEFCSTTSGLVKVYLGSFHVNIFKLHITGDLSDITYRLRCARCRIYGILYISWDAAVFNLRHGLFPILLPAYAYIPPWTLHNLSTALHEPFALRLLCSHAGLTYVLTADRWNISAPERVCAGSVGRASSRVRSSMREIAILESPHELDVTYETMDANGESAISDVGVQAAPMRYVFP